jgi:hypothetical protein
VDKKGVISWPSFTGDRLNKAIVRGENPDSSWTTYQGRVVRNKYFGEFKKNLIMKKLIDNNTFIY